MAENEKGNLTRITGQQFELSSISLDGAESRLVEDLEHGYRAYARANDESLERVEQQLKAQLQFSHLKMDTLPLDMVQRRQERKFTMKSGSIAHRTRWKRLSQAISTVAAVLVVMVVIASAAILFSVRGHLSTTAGPASHPPTPSIRPSSCDPQFRDPGELAVCKEGLETALNDTRVAGDQKITFFAGYADAQRLWLKFMVAGVQPSADKRSPFPYPQWSIGRLTMQGKINLGGGTSAISYDQQKKVEQVWMMYSVDKIPAGTSELHLSAQIDVLTSTGRTQVVTIDISRPIPFRTEKRMATPNQVVTVNGQAVTLDRIIVTPSETTMYLSNDKIAMTNSEGGRPPLGTLSGDGWSAQSFLSERRDAHGKLIGGVLTWNEPLFDKQGMWNLKLQVFEGPAGNGIWTFKFTVPPAANP